MTDLRLAPEPGIPRSEFERVRDAMSKSAAILFADLEQPTELSRTLPTATYLVEQLNERDAGDLDLDPLRLKYTTLREMGPEVGEKVMRYIAHLPVCEIS